MHVHPNIIHDTPREMARLCLAHQMDNQISHIHTKEGQKSLRREFPFMVPQVDHEATVFRVRDHHQSSEDHV